MTHVHDESADTSSAIFGSGRESVALFNDYGACAMGMDIAHELAHGGSGRPDAAEIFATRGYDCIHIPPQLFDVDMKRFTVAIVRSVQRMEPAYTPMHKAVYRILARLAEEGVKAGPDALVLGLLLASAKLHGVRIETPLRSLAKECKMRYAILLKIRRVAMTELGAV